MAVVAASFSTEMFSMSLGFTLSRLHSTPSTSTRGLKEEVEKEPSPRMRMVAPSEPGWPDPCMTLIPGASPARDAEGLTMDLPSDRVP